MAMGKVPVAPVHDVGQALENPFVAERHGVRDYHYPDGRTVKLVSNPIRIPGVDLPDQAAPSCGEHTDTLLAEAGFDADGIAELRRLGVVA